MRYLTRRLFLLALPLAVCLALIFPAIASAHALDSGNLSVSNTGQLDGPGLFNLVMITLVELCAIFWVGAQLWLNFVLQLSSDAHKEQRPTNQRVQQRFERRWSVPTLGVLLLANIGVLVGQALNVTGGRWTGGAFFSSLLFFLSASGRFGTYWIMSEVVTALALLLALYVLLVKQGPRVVTGALPLLNLGLGLTLFIAISMSSPAAAVNGTLVVYAVLVDWLHLLAAALWIGGMLYVALNYLPAIGHLPTVERVRSLLTILPSFSILAIAGIVMMAITGPLSASFQLTSAGQLLSTAYGRALLVKILLVAGLLLTSAIHSGLLRPRLKKEYQKYAYVAQRLQSAQSNVEAPHIVPTRSAQQFIAPNSTPQNPGTPSLSPNSTPHNTGAQFTAPNSTPPSTVTTSTAVNESPATTANIAQQVKLREGRLTQKANRLTSILRWEPLLGVAILVCVGLMNIFVGTLTSTAATQQPTPTKPFTTIVKTQDNKFSVTLNVNPNRFGTNVFTVSVVDNSTNQPVTNIGVVLSTTMLDMDMGTSNVSLQPDGKGHFSASSDFSMAGNWEIRIQIRTPDRTLHEAKVHLLTPF